MSSRLIRWIAVVVVIALVLFGGWRMFRSRSASTNTTAQFATATVTRGDIRDSLSESGPVEVQSQQTIQAEVQGTVSAVHVKDGDRVTAGQPLVELTNEDLAREVQSAELDVTQARLRLAQLLGVSEDQAMTATVPDTSQVPSTSEGRITDILVKDGQNVTADTPLVRLVDDTSLIFVAKVIQPEMEAIHPGQDASIYTDGFVREGIPAVVSTVDRHGTPKDGVIWYDVELTVQNPGALQPGMTGQVNITSGSTVIRRDGSYRLPDAVTVVAPFAAKVDQVAVSVGDWVDNGQTVTTLDTTSSQVDITSNRLQVEKAELALKTKREQLAKLTIAAPIDGVVDNVNVNVGDAVGGGAGSNSTALMTITNDAEMQIVIPVDELDIAQLQEGQAANISVQALPGKTFSGKVAAIAFEGQARNGVTTFNVTVTIDNPQGLRPGMNADVSLVIAEVSNVLRVPSEAVTVGQQADRGIVMIVKDGTPTPQPVTIGLRTASWTEIKDGLQEGQEIVTASTGGGSNGGLTMFPGGGGGRFPQGGERRVPSGRTP